jgi:uncharacterized protein (DUF488 family)
VTAIADVRSKPVSRMNPEFSRLLFQQKLKEVDISYVFLGKELGARTPDLNCYEKGKVQYERLAATNNFQEGLNRIKGGMAEHRIALLCAEKEPLECHRCILVGRHLYERGNKVAHILADGRLEEHSQSMNRLKNILGLSRPDLFRGENEILDLAYQIQGEKITYAQNVDGMSMDYGLGALSA